MKVSAVAMYHLAIQFDGTAYRMADGETTYTAIDSTIVRIDTDAGLTGWGEICPWGPTYLPEFRDGARSAIALMAPALIGRDPTNLNEIGATMARQLAGHYYAKSAIDLACWDILGKAAGLPVGALLGGRVSEAIPLASAVFRGPPEEMIERIGRRRAEGYGRFSTKACGDVACDRRQYRKIADQRREGEIYIADANRAWDLMSALSVAPLLQELDFAIEQPCESYAECLRVGRNRTGLMILDELVIDDNDLSIIAKDGAADMVQLKLSRIGGLTPAKRMLDFCLVAGLGVIWATSGGSEISDAAVIQIASVTPPSRLLATWSCREFNAGQYAEGGPEIVDGHAIPSSRPGLGVAPDMDRLGKPLAAFRGG